jgi:hypothetical protein
MRSQGLQTPKRFPFRGSLLFLCVVAVCICDARCVWATCGDYLAGSGGHSMAGHGISDRALAGHQSNDSEPMPVCTGPQCHQRDPAPVAPPRTVSLPQSSDAILCSIARLTLGDQDSLFRATTADQVVDGPADSFFRPPRAV